MIIPNSGPGATIDDERATTTIVERHERPATTKESVELPACLYRARFATVDCLGAACESTQYSSHISKQNYNCMERHTSTLR